MSTAARRHAGGVPEGCPLSRRQYQVMCGLAAGRTYLEIARGLGISHSTVREHAHVAFRHLGVTGRGASCAVVAMKDSGWLGAKPRRPQEPPDPHLTPVQLAYAACFAALCRERTSRAAAIVTVAFGLLTAVHALPSRPRQPPDIDELLLRLARGVTRPIPQ